MIPLFIVLFLSFSSVSHSLAEEQTLEFGRFGKVWTYQENSSPSHVVLFISGDGGWNLGVVEMAKSLAKLDSLVIGVDITHYLKKAQSGKEKCLYPASDFETLSQFVQKEKGFSDYKTPVLVGYSSGATLAYTVLAQAPSNTFQGTLSLGFCEDLPLSKPMCSGQGLKQEPLKKKLGFRFLPRKELEKPWYVLHGEIDQVCSFEEVSKFVNRVSTGSLVFLPKVGHGFSIQKNWMPQFKSAFQKITRGSLKQPKVSLSSLKDLPLVEIPVSNNQNDTLAVIVSGDGGWAAIDKEIGNQLALRGIPVVGFNSLQYFWKKRSPNEAAKDLERTLLAYLQAWGKNKILLIGYSFGADVLPFMMNKLDVNLKNKISKLVLLAPGKFAHFEFKVTHWFGSSGSSNPYPLEPEIIKEQRTPVLCVYGKEDSRDGICPSLTQHANPNFKAIALDGGHHFGKEFNTLTKIILGE
ncbi:MAG: type IV secretory pathway VirJ component [Nitrospinales bacterium]|jgi:type IV secretory pathway VirJ component